MDHLTPDQLVDAAERTTNERVMGHLRACERCQRDVVGLQAAMAAAADADVPEPSAFFWEAMSARVRTSIAAEAPGSPGWWMSWRVLMPMSAAAAVLLAVVMAPGLRDPADTGVADSAAAASVSAGSADLAAAPEVALAPTVDPAFDVLKALASDLDWEAASELGLSTGAGTIDRLVFELSDDEREELRRLLHEELGRNGA
jgi:hypothetical protein